MICLCRRRHVCRDREVVVVVENEVNAFVVAAVVLRVLFATVRVFPRVRIGFCLARVGLVVGESGRLLLWVLSWSLLSSSVRLETDFQRRDTVALSRLFETICK